MRGDTQNLNLMELGSIHTHYKAEKPMRSDESHPLGWLNLFALILAFCARIVLSIPHSDIQDQGFITKSSRQGRFDTEPYSSDDYYRNLQ